MPVPKQSSVPGDRCSPHCSLHAVQVPGYTATSCNTVISRHFKWPILPVLHCHRKTPDQRRQGGALPTRVPAQDFLCQSGAEEVDSMAHATAAQVREPHSLAPHSCTEWMPAVPAVHDAACPCTCTFCCLPGEKAHCTRLARLPACRAGPVHPTACWTCLGAILWTLHKCHLAAFRCTCHGANLPLALPHVQHL